MAFAQQVAIALQASVGTYDVPPQSYNFVSNLNNNVAIPSLSFPTSFVRSAQVTYNMFRATNSNAEAETGVLELVYNPNAASGHKWEMTREFTGTSGLNFTVDDTGQIYFSTTLLAGSNFSGTLVFTARTLQQSY